MTSFLFKIEIGQFIGDPTDSVWSHNIDQDFELHVEAESLSAANKVIERRFGDYTRCRYKYTGHQYETS